MCIYNYYIDLSKNFNSVTSMLNLYIHYGTMCIYKHGNNPACWSTSDQVDKLERKAVMVCEYTSEQNFHVDE